MTWWNRFYSWLSAMLRRSLAEREMEAEFRFHVEARVEDLLRSGVPRGQAMRQAQIEFGGIEQVKEECRDARGVTRIEALVQDLRHGIRMLRKNPGFTAVAVLTLALGIGASTAIYSVVDAVLLQALPYPDPQRIVRVWEQAPDGHRMNLADPNFDDFRAQNDAFSALAVFNYAELPVAGGSEPVRIMAAAVSKDFFTVLGVQPLLGRRFAPGEQQLNGARATVVSYGYWQRYLGSSMDLSQFHLSMNDGVYSVVGVMPPGFDFPQGAALWIAREIDPEIPSRTAHSDQCLGRLREGVTVAAARANLSAIAGRLKDQYGKEVDLNSAAVVPLAEAMVGDVRPALLTLLGAVGLLLLVSCANVGGLLLARASARRKELAVRAALGAGRGRLIQQFLAESFALSFAGGVPGVLIANGAVRLLPAILPASLPRQQDIAMNTSVLLFALAAVVVVAFSLGLFAAWRTGTGDLQDALSAGSRGSTDAAAGRRFRGLLVTGEIAVTLVLLIGAGLLGRSFLRLISMSPGFRQENLITMEFLPPIPQGQVAMEQTAIVRQVHLMDALLKRLRAIPGVEAAGLSGALPAAEGDNLAGGRFLILHGRAAPADFGEWEHMAQDPSNTGDAYYCVAGEGYFRTLGIALLRGRMFNDQDALNTPHVAVISQSLARRRWPNQDPIGQVIDFGNMDGNLKPLTIVGIAGDVRALGLDSPPTPIIYVDYRQRGMNANSSPTIVMRSAAPGGEIVSAARGIFRELAPDVPVKFSTFTDEMGRWLANRRFLLLLMGFFAAVALVLAAVGIYGLVAFSVSRRTQEIGIRMALGARRRDVLRLILRESARLAAAGVAIGIAASLAVTRLISTLLFGITATDPWTFSGVAVLLSVVALFAAFAPAMRSTRVDPTVALRYE